MAARGLEGCDDNNTAAGDGCNSTCAVEVGDACNPHPHPHPHPHPNPNPYQLGYACVSSPGAPDVCSSVCGDARRVGAEGCDDGNEVSAPTLNPNPGS